MSHRCSRLSYIFLPSTWLLPAASSPFDRLHGMFLGLPQKEPRCGKSHLNKPGSTAHKSPKTQH